MICEKYIILSVDAGHLEAGKRKGVGATLFAEGEVVATEITPIHAPLVAVQLVNVVSHNQFGCRINDVREPQAHFVLRRACASGELGAVAPIGKNTVVIQLFLHCSFLL